MKEPRYYLSHKLLGEVQVTKEQFIEAEKAAGFHSKTGPGTCATGGFGIGGNALAGHVRYGEEDTAVESSEEDLLTRLANVIREAREEGYVVACWTPDEVDGVDRGAMSDVVVSRGNDFISDSQEDRP